MNKGLVKYSSLFLFVLIGLSACGGGSFKIEEGEKISLTNQKLILSENKKSEGNFYSPENVNLTYTYTKLASENRINQTYLPIEEGKINNQEILIIPMHFKDSSLGGSLSKATKTRNDIIKSVLDESNENLGYLSLKKYYEETSFGKINLNFTVTDWFDTKVNSDDIKSSLDVSNLIINSLDKLSVNGEKLNDLTKFDTNKDGLLDAVFAIYDVYDFKTSGNKNSNLWAYSDFNKNIKPNKKSPSLGQYSWASFNFLYDGYGNEKIDTHLFIHEYGHLFGLTDYYDYNHNVEPLAVHDMMAYNVLDLNAYSKMALGLIKPYVVIGDSTLNVEEIKTKNSCVVILEDDKNLIKEKDKIYFNPFSEYILLEYFDHQKNANYNDLFNGYKDILDGTNGFQKSGWKAYHINATRLYKNEKETLFYDSHAPLKAKGKLEQVFTNTTKGDSLRYEEYILNKFNASDLSFENINYCNEITLLAKKTKYANNFKKLYKTSLNGEIYTMPIDSDYLFFNGDTFDFNAYESYFINGIKSEKLIFDNKKTFSTRVYFE